MRCLEGRLARQRLLAKPGPSPVHYQPRLFGQTPGELYSSPFSNLLIKATAKRRSIGIDDTVNIELVGVDWLA